MKKTRNVLAILLAMLLVTGLAACGGGGSTGGDTTAAPAETTAAAAETTAAAAETTAAAAETTAAAAETTGDTLKFCYLAEGTGFQWPIDVDASYKKLSKDLGFEYQFFDADENTETQLNQVDEAITAGADAIFFQCVDEGMASAVAQKCNEAGVLLIGESRPLMDSDGKYVCPMVMLDAAACGGQCGTWICENAESLGFDLSDLSKVGIMVGLDSRVLNEVWRADAARDAFIEGLGVTEDDIIYADVAGATVEDKMLAGSEVASTIIASHPEKEIWLAVGVEDDLAVGVCRAFESAGLADKAILSSVGGERVVGLWAEGQGAPWYSASYFHGMFAAENIVDVANKVLKDGVPATEVLPPDEGQEYGYMYFTGSMITMDDYQDKIVVLD